LKPVVLALAQGSRHPLSVALRTALEKEGVTPAHVDNIHEEPGFGMRGRYLGASVSLGRPAAADGDDRMAVSFQIEGMEPHLLRFRDAIRPDAEATVARLADLGIRGSIASGDHAESVLPVAQALDLPAEAGMRPEDKLAAIDRLAAGGAKVLMVGDGLNDGPALAAGHASIAPASASDVGQTAADAVFMGDSLAPITTAVLVARRTMRIVRQNFTIAISYNMVAIPLAFMGLVTPLVAALAMSGSSIIVVANALRLGRAPR
jgi:Cu2+-exporting ATPase